MKFIRLDNHRITLTDETYAQIEKLINQDRLCGKCYGKFTPANPMVLEDKCLQCSLRDEHRGLQFLGPLSRQDEATSDYTTYQFIDARGYIYLSYSSGTRPEISMYRTIKHHGFPVPESIAGERLDFYSWHIHGNFRLNVAIVIEYRESYGDHLTAFWIAYKGTELIKLNKREKATQKLLKRARAQLEATRDSESYHIEGGVIQQIFDSHLYSVIPDIMSAEAE